MAISNARNYEELEETRDKLRQERDKAQMYLDIAGVIFVALNREGEVILINRKGCEVLGYDEGEIFGKNWFEHFIPQSVREEVGPLAQKLLSGEEETAKYSENPILTKDGKERIIAWHNTILKDEQGNIIGHLSSGDDITERKLQEEEREKLILKLQEASNKVKILRGMLPICSHCKKIRDDKGYWNQIENYIHQHSEAEFSHGICPECVKKLYPDFDLCD